MAKKYYAVLQGRTPGIYQTWDEAKEQILGFSNAQYKSFSDLVDAQAYFNTAIDPNTKLTEPEHSNNILQIYTDGSANKGIEKSKQDPHHTQWSGAYVLYDVNDNEIIEQDAFTGHHFFESQQIAGELESVLQALTNVLTNFDPNYYPKIQVCFDYMGVGQWAQHHWQASKPVSQYYQKNVDLLIKELEQKGFQIEFKKVKAHSNVKLNELVNDLAQAKLEAFNQQAKII